MNEVLEELNDYESKGYQIVYLDETLITTKTINKYQYCQKQQNFVISDTDLGHRAKAILMAITNKIGVVTWM